MGVWGLGALIACLLLGSCAGSDGKPVPIATEDFERVTLFGVSFGHPAGWEPCRFPGNVSPGPLVEVAPPDLVDGTPPLSVQVSGRSIESWIELDRTFLGPDPDVEVEPAEVAGAEEAQRASYRGAAFGFQYVAIAVYARHERNVTKVSWYSDPSDLAEGEATLDAVVDTLDFDVPGDDTELPDCGMPDAPTPRPEPEDTEVVPDEIAGTYEMTITRDQLDESEALSATERREWTLILEGDELAATGETGTGTTSITFPILEASTTQLVLEGSDCDNPREAMEVTMSFVADGDSLEVLGLAPVCDERLREIFTINVWEKV